MKFNIVIKLVTFLVIAATLFLSGCRNYLVPEQGTVALEDSRIALPAEGVKDALWEGKQMKIKYSLSPNSNGLVISGTMTVNDSVLMSFQAIERLLVKLTFLDDLGRVLETADITPFYGTFNEVTGPLSFKSVVVPPPGTTSFAFSYWGSFKGVPREVTESLEVFYFPFQ